MQRINKKRSHIRTQQQGPSNMPQLSVEIPHNLGKLSIVELKGPLQRPEFFEHRTVTDTYTTPSK